MRSSVDSRPRVKTLGDGETCAACVASRRSVVDAFFLGFRAGFNSAVVAAVEGRGEVDNIERPVFCVAHEKMSIEAYVAELRACMNLKPP